MGTAVHPEDGIAARRKMFLGQFPMTTGSRWVYTIRDSIRHRTDTAHVRIVGSRVLPDGHKAMLWVYRIHAKIDTEYAVVSGDTITFRRNMDPQSSRVRFVFPLVPGKRWSVHPPGTTEVRKIMTVKTPAENFPHAFEVVQQPAVRNFVGGTTFWLVPRVGIVQIHRKSIDTINNQEEDARWELLSWTVK